MSFANPSGGFKLGGLKLGSLIIKCFPENPPTEDTPHSDSSEDYADEKSEALAQQCMLPPSSAEFSSFASLIQNTEFHFGLQKQKKVFAGAGAMLFQSQKEEHNGGDINPGSEPDIDFKPLMSLIYYILSNTK